MTELRKGLPPLPPRFLKLPLDARGYPVPKFVAWVNGAPDFRVIDPRHMKRCIDDHMCWLCGDKLGRHLAFVIGPMCCVNRVSSEPPSHLECAEFAVKACPFMLHPQAKRREANLPEGTKEPAGVMIPRNPGVMLIWVTDGYKIMRSGDGVLFRINRASQALWYKEGRAATRDEVQESINSGLPILIDMVKNDDREMREMHACHLDAMRLLPRE